MTRSPVTVAALVGDDRQVTRGFLALLAGTLTLGDQVVLVGPRHVPSAPGSWRVMGPKKLVRAPARPRLHERVVVVDERAVPVGPWLEDLVAGLDDPLVGAAAARTNAAGGDELFMGVPYRPHETDLHRALVRSLATARSGERSPAKWLAGPSLALRRAMLEDVGELAALLGPSPVASVAQRVAAAGRDLVVAEGSYLHHGGGPSPRPLDLSAGPRPFVSACMITKDEHDNLPRCLESLHGFVDEIVVYDTGSVDDTREIALERGATVIEGNWDGDFARARNEALARCSGQWVLWIDADESLACEDRAAARTYLANLSSDAEGLIVLIDNLRGTEASTVLTHPACRLFRRSYAHWTGRLHEQVTAREGATRLATPLDQGLRITHWGYLESAITGRAKGRRNLESAFGDLMGDADLPWGYRLLSLGRSYGLAGRPEEAVALCRAAAASADSPSTRRGALRAIVENLRALGRAEEALVETDALRQQLVHPMLADTLEGRALLALGRYEEALAALDRVVDGLDDDGYEHTVHGVAALKASALLHLDRHGEAADVLLAGLQAAGGMDAHLVLLVGCLERAGRPLSELARAVPSSRAVAFLGQVVHLEPDLADRILEAWYETAPSRAVLATATGIADRLPVERLRTWSERLRDDHLAYQCPLVRTASAPARPLADRLVGAALAVEAFGDPRGRQAFGALAVQVDRAERETVRDRLGGAAPSLLELYDDLVPPDDARPPAPMDARGEPVAEVRRRVLVVARQVADLRTLAVAAALRQVGHEVTVLHPQPVAPSKTLLVPLGIDVWGWPGGSGGPGGWLDAAASAVARVYADRPLDTVVLTRSAADALPVARRLLPAAQVVLDTDYVSRFPAEGTGALDLVLASTRLDRVAGDAPTVLLEASAPFLYAPPAPVIEQQRSGICVVGAFAATDDEDLRHWTEVGAELARHAARLPLAVVGHDPGGRFAEAVPWGLAVGPLADPLPWLGTARVVLVAAETGAEHWLAAAAMCGTPALVVPTDQAARAQVAPAVTALADPSQAALWSRFAPVPGPQPVPLVDDPLGLLSSPYRCHEMDPGAQLRADVRRGSPPDLTLPSGRPVIAELTWPYGGVPAEWVGPLRDLAEEVRVHSSWTRSHAVRSGLSAARVSVVTTCVDTERFTPHGKRTQLDTRKMNKLLFAGDASDGDGIDALLEAYLMAFDADDDVCLVVHLLDGEGRWAHDVRQAAARSRERAQVVVLEDHMGDEQRAGLYRACDALVQPHRAPSSLRPLAEAMACGLPVAALDAGPSRELCDERTGWLIACREVAVQGADLGVTPSSHGLWQLEPDRTSLAEVLREVIARPEQRLLKGLAARDRISTACAGGTSSDPGAAPSRGLAGARST